MDKAQKKGFLLTDKRQKVGSNVNGSIFTGNTFSILISLRSVILSYFMFHYFLNNFICFFMLYSIILVLNAWEFHPDLVVIEWTTRNTFTVHGSHCGFNKTPII